jgi:hypothetical protein
MFSNRISRTLYEEHRVTSVLTLTVRSQQSAGNSGARAQRGNPESIIPEPVHGFRARRFAAPRNDHACFRRQTHNTSALMERFDGLISANRQRPPDTTAPATALAHVQKEKWRCFPSSRSRSTARWRRVSTKYVENG